MQGQTKIGAQGLHALGDILLFQGCFTTDLQSYVWECALFALSFLDLYSSAA